MGQLDQEKANLLAGTIHEAISTAGGDAGAQKAKLQAANKLLIEASTTTRQDKSSQDSVLQTLNQRVNQAGYHIEGYGSKGDTSYLLMRTLNGGKTGQPSDVVYCPIAADGTVSMQPAPRDANGQLKLPGDNPAPQTPTAGTPEAPAPTTTGNPTEVPVPTNPTNTEEVPQPVEPGTSNRNPAAPAAYAGNHDRDSNSYPAPINPAAAMVRSEALVRNPGAVTTPTSEVPATPAETSTTAIPAADPAIEKKIQNWQKVADSERKIAARLHEIAKLPDEAAREKALQNLDPEMKARVFGNRRPDLKAFDCEARAGQFEKLVKYAENEVTRLKANAARAAVPEAAPAASAPEPAPKVTVPETAPGAEPVAAPETAAPKASRFKLPEFVNSPLAGRVAVGGLSAFGVFAGISQVNAGLEQIAGGNTGIGSLQVLGGAANIGAGSLGFNFLSKNPLPWAGTMAMRLGGGANLIGGGLELYNGLKTGDGVQTFDGAVYSATGALMLKCPTNPVGWGAAVFGTAYGLTRIGMQATGGDKWVTGKMDSAVNGEANRTADEISKANLAQLDSKGANVIMQSYEQMKASNTTARDVSGVILGLREKMLEMRTAGQNVAEVEAEVKRLMEIRGVLAQEERQAQV